MEKKLPQSINNCTIDNKIKKTVAIIATHPIQYQAPLFQELSKSKNISFKIFYASKHAYKSIKKDREFNKKFNWGNKILDGYNFIFSKKSQNVNNWSLDFPEIKQYLLKENLKGVLLNGWNKKLYLRVFIFCIFSKIPMYLRAENNLEQPNTIIIKILKKIIFPIFFHFFKKIFYIGYLNKIFYLNFYSSF